MLRKRKGCGVRNNLCSTILLSHCFWSEVSDAPEVANKLAFTELVA
jgi:hypothetical protein